jgi:hypothetical protein
MGGKFIGDRLLCSARIYVDVRNYERYEDRKRETGLPERGFPKQGVQADIFGEKGRRPIARA